MYRKRDNFKILQVKSLVVARAYEFAQKAHEGQLRKDDTPFIEHPLRVAQIIYKEWGIDNENIIAAAILHDTVEDDDETTLETIRASFGSEIADLVDGVTKLESATDLETQKKVLSKTKLFPPVALLKLADRLDNMRTLQHMSIDKQIETANETLNVYTPLAEAMGMWIVKTELEDLAFKFLGNSYDENYEDFKKQIDSDPRRSPGFIEYYLHSLSAVLDSANIHGQIEVRKSGVRTLEQKIGKDSTKGTTYWNLEDITDLTSFRVIVDSIPECYLALGYIHSNFQQFVDPNRLDEYIVSPRINGYSALHSTLNLPQGPTEIAITTKERENFNNWGVVELIKRGENNLSKYVLNFIFTPDGEVRFAKPEASAVDIAYMINPDQLGRKIKAIEIDGVEYGLNALIPNAAAVKIITSEKNELIPLVELMKKAALPQTHEIIKKQINKEQRYHAIEKGKEKIMTVVSEYGLMYLEDFQDVVDPKNLTAQMLSSVGASSLNDVYYKVGRKEVSVKLRKIKKWFESAYKNNSELYSRNISTIFITGHDIQGVFRDVASWTDEINGDVKKIQQLSQDGMFTMRMVVEDLDEQSLKIFKQRLTSDERKRFVECIVV